LNSTTYEELSEEWDVPVGTLLSRKHRALSKLHKILLNNQNEIMETTENKYEKIHRCDGRKHRVRWIYWLLWIYRVCISFRCGLDVALELADACYFPPWCHYLLASGRSGYTWQTPVRRYASWSAQ